MLAFVGPGIAVALTLINGLNESAAATSAPDLFYFLITLVPFAFVGVIGLVLIVGNR